LNATFGPVSGGQTGETQSFASTGRISTSNSEG
jgi:hypothetical protein